MLYENAAKRKMYLRGLQRKGAGLARKQELKPDRLTALLRERIRQEEWKPGERLPTRRELQEEFQVSSSTLQKSFRRLAWEGFIISRGKSGTFVAANLPHRCRYGLVFPEHEHEISSNLFARTIYEVVHRIESETPKKFVTFRAVHEADGTPDYRALKSEIRNRLLAGLIFIRELNISPSSSIISSPETPGVLLTANDRKTGLPWVDLGAPEPFFEKAIGYLREKGRRRIALLMVSGDRSRMEIFHRVTARENLETHPYWIQVVHALYADWAANLVHLLFNPEQGSYPDGLIVADDHLLEPVCEGLKQARMDVPGSVDVVVHGNFPLIRKGPENIVRLGYDIDKALRTCLSIIDSRKHNFPAPPRTVIEPVFEWER
jgi:DNA-binding LacI/PurR family transcriptional regulator